MKIILQVRDWQGEQMFTETKELNSTQIERDVRGPQAALLEAYLSLKDKLVKREAKAVLEIRKMAKNDEKDRMETC